jgi:hypothetical protein
MSEENTELTEEEIADHEEKYRCALIAATTVIPTVDDID